MMNGLTKKVLTLATFVVLSLAAAPAAFADTFTEVGDAPGVLPGQSVTGGANPLTAINGTISGPIDADVFRIYISSPATFSATTCCGFASGSLSDTQLFLFTPTGFGILANDNFNGQFAALLGNVVPGLTPGEYLLAITSSDVDPIGEFGEIFPDVGGFTPPDSFRGTRPLVFFIGSSSGVGTYTINLTGASFVAQPTAVPEPATILLLGTGLASVGAALRRRRHGAKSVPA